MQLADTVNQIINDDQIMRLASKNARKVFLKFFSEEILLEQLVKMFKKIKV